MHYKTESFTKVWIAISKARVFYVSKSVDLPVHLPLDRRQCLLSPAPHVDENQHQACLPFYLSTKF
jgi:hypothetical protein